LALCLSIFLVVLASTIIATAVPRITEQFNSLNDVGWYGSAYLLTTSGFQLVFGKLYTFFSIKWVYLIAIAVFELGSLVCGVAPNSAALIVGRAIAGLGSAGIFSGAYLIIAMSQPLEKRPVFQGLFGAIYGVASIVGPLMGGAFTAKVTWRWCFYINLPIGGVALAVIFFFFNPVPHGGEDTTNRSLTWRQRLKQLDTLGTTFFLAGVVCLLVALQWGGSTYPWSSGRVIALLVVFGICLVVFVGIQFWRPETATIDPRMMRKRSIWAAGAFTFCLGSAFFVIIYYLPIWFQAVKGVSAYQSGIRNIPFLVTGVMGSVISGALVTQTGYYAPFMLASSALTAVDADLLTTFDLETGHAKWIAYQVIVGFGIGLGLQQPQIAIQAVLGISEIPVATALMFFFQLFGAAVFVSVGESVLTNRVISYISRHVPGVDAAEVAMAGATSFRSVVPAQYVRGIVQEYNMALKQVFEMALVMACLTTLGSLAVEWRSVKGKKMEVGA
ncbi:major facilitator superfamily, partial [Usnea florida]